ncbi:MAG TPA: hypothetical protein DCM40_46585, partial [Maribacter sp.]|nr:hypothetical protein [Maribacter sp.]
DTIVDMIECIVVENAIILNADCMDINDDLITQWEPKIQKMVSTSYIAGLDKEDIAQELRISLVKAAKAFNPDKGAIFHTYLHTSLVNTIRTLINKAQSQLNSRSIDMTDIYETTPAEIIRALTDPNHYQEEVDISLWVDSQNLANKEKLFLQLKLEGLTMEEITEDLGESAYKVRQGLRDKLQQESDTDEDA